MRQLPTVTPVDNLSASAGPSRLHVRADKRAADKYADNYAG